MNYMFIINIKKRFIIWEITGYAAEQKLRKIKAWLRGLRLILFHVEEEFNHINDSHDLSSPVHRYIFHTIIMAK